MRRGAETSGEILQDMEYKYLPFPQKWPLKIMQNTFQKRFCFSVFLHF